MPTTWPRALAWRLHRHHLAARDGGSVVEVVRRLAGVQAQVASSARQAVAVRRPAAEVAGTAAAIDAAVGDRALVRTWSVRGTLHLLPADAVADQLALLASARTWEKASWQRTFAPAAEVEALTAAAEHVLDGALLTRDELVDALAGAVSSRTAEGLASGWGALLKPLAWQGVLCNGPPRDGRPTFTAPRSWIPGWSGLPDADEAAHRVVPSYLAAHGPASPTTVDAWLLRGATPKARLRRWFAELVEAGTLRTVVVDGETLYARARDVDALEDALEDAATPAGTAGTLRLLPAFDPWILGPGTAATAVVPPEHRSAVSRAAGWIAPVVVVGGRVVGTWAAGDGGTPVLDLFPGAAAVDPAELAAETARWRTLTGAS